MVSSGSTILLFPTKSHPSPALPTDLALAVDVVANVTAIVRVATSVACDSLAVVACDFNKEYADRCGCEHGCMCMHLCYPSVLCVCMHS